MALTRFLPRKCTVFAVMTSLATLMAPALAYADAASDIRSDSSLRLWLDGFDTNAANSNGYGTVSNPVSGQPVRTWRDKSSHGHHAVDATPPLYGNAATWSNQGVFFNYNSLARFELPISVYGNSPSNAMEVIAFARAGDSGTMGNNQPLLEMRNDGLGVVGIYVASAGVQQSVNGIVHQSDYQQQQFGTGYLVAG